MALELFLCPSPVLRCKKGKKALIALSIFVALISLVIFLIFGGIHENVGRKNINFGDIHEMQKTKKMKPPAA